MTEGSQAVQEIAPFSIVPWMYEKEIDKKYGVENEKIEKGIEIKWNSLKIKGDEEYEKIYRYSN